MVRMLWGRQNLVDHVFHRSNVIDRFLHESGRRLAIRGCLQTRKRLSVFLNTFHEVLEPCLREEVVLNERATVDGRKERIVFSNTCLRVSVKE